jgi:DNA modification methylase
MAKNNQAAELASVIGPHRVHPFPARMAPAIALGRLRQPKSVRVLDPMSGSGTTLVVAKMLGHEAIGFDTDPLAVMIAKAWCQGVNEEEVKARAETVLASAQRRYRNMPGADAYPMGADEETKAFVRFWFDDTNRRQLACLSRAISAVHDDAERSILWCVLSRMIITKGGGVSRAMDVSHSRPHREFDIAPFKAFSQFPIVLKAVLRAAPFKNQRADLKTVKVRQADARAIPLKDRSVDIVITSPPYLNMIDYMRGHKLSLVWLGKQIKDLREIRSSNIGTEVSIDARKDAPYLEKILARMTKVESLSDKHQGMLSRYVMDMDGVVREIYRVLVRGGKATFVVGDSTLKGVFIQNSAAIRSLAREHGFTLRSQTSREIPEGRRYLPPPTARDAGSQFQARMREEVILTFSKN